MIPLPLPLLVLLLALVSTTTSTSPFNITHILSKHPQFSTFNTYLTKTHLASEINIRDTITVLALDNAEMASLLSKHFTLPTLRNVLSLHILVDYYGAKKLHQITDGSTTTASMFQSSGDADGNSGYVNITDLHGGKVGFSPVDADGMHSYFVKSLVEMPYSISIVQISQVLDSAQAEAPMPEPSSVNLTTLLDTKGCKEFSSLLTSSGAAKTFQENIDSGLTVFCVGDSAVKSFMPKYKNLTAGNKTSLLLYHGVPVYNSMGMLKSNNGIMNTLATDGSNKYDFTVQNDDESVTLITKVVTAEITGTLVDKDPLAVYKLDQFLLPRELFKPSKTSTHKTHAHAPSPDAESPDDDVADGPDSSDNDDVADSTSKKQKKNSASMNNRGGIASVTLALCCVLPFF